MGGGLEGREQGLAGILARHAQELAQGQRGLQLAAPLEGGDVRLSGSGPIASTEEDGTQVHPGDGDLFDVSDPLGVLETPLVGPH